MAIAPFHFRLKKVAAREQRLLDAVYAFLPATEVREEFGRSVREAVAQQVGEGFSLRLEAVVREPFSAFLAKIPSLAVMAVFGLAPLSRRGILEIDPLLALAVVERLLGGQGEGVPELRPLSDTEQGVLQYVVLKLMARVRGFSGEEARAHATFDRFAFEPREVRNLAAGEDEVAVLAFRVLLGRCSGFVRLVLPDPLVEEGFLKAEGPGGVRGRERVWRRRQLMRFASFRASLVAEAGRTTLTASELQGLEEGDVVLLDESGLSLDGRIPRGRVVLRVKEGEGSGIDAEIDVRGGRARAKVVGVHTGA